MAKKWLASHLQLGPRGRAEVIRMKKKGEGNLIVGEIEETLFVTPKGNFLLEIAADGLETKSLTQDEAKVWYETHFPSLSWENALN
jgi:hypothetical protein